MTSLTPDQIAASWAQALGAATTKITAGVNAVQVSPGAAAARNKQAYIANVTANVDKWASRSAAVTVEQWRTATTTKGIPRIASGAQAAQSKFSAFMQQLLPYVARQVASLPPRGNLDANIARSAAFARGMAQFNNTSQG